jgi:predicted DNA-binding protein
MTVIKEKRVEFRLNEVLYQKLRCLAQEAQVPVAEYLRDFVKSQPEPKGK